jgi:NAD(P)-dependent dehydrogenase (short-subunit alcohol dehydrogenase family)
MASTGCGSRKTGEIIYVEAVRESSVSMHVDYTAKTAVVTRGASGIGHRPHAGQERAASMGGHSFAVDMTALSSLEAAFARVSDLDVVMANAGRGSGAGVLETSVELWEKTLAVNLTGVFHTLRIAARKMKERGTGGAIVVTASTNSFDGEPRHLAYNANKSDLLGALHTAATELGVYGIRVNAVCPGLIRTRLSERHFAKSAVLKDYFRHIPLGRGGEAQEVADADVFLASDRASFITGSTLFVDGGQMASKFGPWNEDFAEFQFDAWKLK